MMMDAAEKTQKEISNTKEHRKENKQSNQSKQSKHRSSSRIAQNVMKRIGKDKVLAEVYPPVWFED